MKKLPFSYFHVFPFSEREGTAAVKMSGQVNFQTKKERSKILRKLSNQKKEAFYKNQIGSHARVLMEEKNDAQLFQGFTDNYVKVGVETTSDLANEFIDVSIDNIVNENLALGTILN